MTDIQFPCWNNYPCRKTTKSCCPVRGKFRTSNCKSNGSCYPPGPFNIEEPEPGCRSNYSENYVVANCGRHTLGPGLTGPMKLSKLQKERLLPVYDTSSCPNVSTKKTYRPQKMKCGSGKRKKPFYSLINKDKYKTN